MFWIPNCLGRQEPAGWMHIHAACYLAVGPERTLLVDTGHPAHWTTIEATLARLLDGRSLDFVFPTHTEIPHAGNLGRLLTRFPDAIVVGDTRDYHLYFPDATPRLSPRASGDVIDLGDGWRFEFADAAIRDLPNTLWGFLSPSRLLFVSDGFMLSHHASADGSEPLHAPTECVLTTAELDWPPDPLQITFVTERSIYWMRYAGAGEAVARMRRAISDWSPSMLAPTHSNVIEDPQRCLAAIGAAWDEIAVTS